MRYGYARCSTNEDKQDITRQIRELKAAGADKIVFEYEHGDAKVKQNLNMLLESAVDGDALYAISRAGCCYSMGQAQVCCAQPKEIRHP